MHDNKVIIYATIYMHIKDLNRRPFMNKVYTLENLEKFSLEKN